MSEVQQDLPGIAPEDAAAAIGAQLRQAREARGETAADVAQALKLTTRQIEAMEAGRLDLLPGAAFARGFLRNYARYVGIDPAVLLSGLEPAQSARPVELAPVSNAEGVMPAGGGVTRAVRLPAAAVGVAVAALVAGWYFDWFRMPDENAVVADSAQPQPSAPDGVLPPVAAQAANPGEPQFSPAPMAPLEAAPAAPAATPAAAPLPPAAPAASPPALPGAAQPADGAAAPAQAAAGVDHLQFRFNGESWVEVRDASGNIVYSGVNSAGTSRTVQGRAPFALVVGNAREVSLEFRGKPYDLTPHIRVSVARVKVE